LIGATFSTAIFLNGLVAILAGVVANVSVQMSGSLAAPFVVSAGTLVFAGLLISSSWEENYGDSKTNASGSVLKSMMEGLIVLKNGKHSARELCIELTLANRNRPPHSPLFFPFFLARRSHCRRKHSLAWPGPDGL